MADFDRDVMTLLCRIVDVLEQLTPVVKPLPDLHSADAFVWHPESDRLMPVQQVSCVELPLLRGIDHQRDTLLDNTWRFVSGLPANNALLWGARGMGKSSLVKAVHDQINRQRPRALVLVEIHRDDIASLPRLLTQLRVTERLCILFCDDLSFEQADTSYKSLKAVLEGGIEGRPDNVIFYATSNRRHLMPRDMIDNERATAIIAGEAVEEKISLSDRFGLWLGFHACDQATYLDMVEGYARQYGLDLPRDQLQSEAQQWAMARGTRSGRVAWQFTQDLAGRMGRRLAPAEGLPDATVGMHHKRRLVTGR